jgi:hypothetical protein
MQTFSPTASPGPGFLYVMYATSTNNATLFLGSNSSVTASSGMQVHLNQPIYVPTPVYAITGTGTAIVWFWWQLGPGGLYISPGQLP